MAALSFECDGVHAAEHLHTCVGHTTVYVLSWHFYCLPFCHVSPVVLDGLEMKFGFLLWTLRLWCCDELTEHVFAVRRPISTFLSIFIVNNIFFLIQLFFRIRKLAVYWRLAHCEKIILMRAIKFINQQSEFMHVVAWECHSHIINLLTSHLVYRFHSSKPHSESEKPNLKNQ